MKTPNFKPQNLGIFEGFKMVLTFEDEYMSAKEHFIGECGWSEEEYKSIKNFYWFSAKITAFKGSIECGSSYLGGCCYKTLKEILSHEGNTSIENVLSGYAPQMIEEAIEEAKQALED